MKYIRTTIEAGVFSDLLPKGSKLYMRPELPKVKFKKNGVKYAVTDLRLLNQEAIRVFEIILNTVIDTPNCREISFNAESADEDTIHVITDILTGMECSAGKVQRRFIMANINMSIWTVDVIAHLLKMCKKIQEDK